MDKPTPQQIAKLPAWARNHITNLERERKAALLTLNEFCDSSTESPFSVSEYKFTGEGRGPTLKRHFIQAHTIRVEWRGVRLEVLANDFGNRGPGIYLRWETIKDGDAAFIPVSYQSARLVTKEDIN